MNILTQLLKPGHETGRASATLPPPPTVIGPKRGE